MKTLHRPELFCWSRFDEARNIDFHGLLWQRPEGNVVIDPLPLSDHDRAHLDALGGAALIVVTNSDHLRDTAALKAHTGAKVAGPAAERDHEGLAALCDIWLEEGDGPVPGLEIFTLDGSKTPGELALRIEGHTLICGDLVRGQEAGRLNMLPAAKLADPARAAASVRALGEKPHMEQIEAVLVGDGWHVFERGAARLHELTASL